LLPDSQSLTSDAILVIKKVKRVIRNYSLRLLLRCGVSWQTH
jgi:hypothetical protein